MLRQIIGSTVGVIALTVAAIKWTPNIAYIEYAPQLLMIGTGALFLITVVSVWKEGELSENGKMILMTGFLLAILVPTVYTASAYTHQLATSWSGGEVHYHADYEVVVQASQEDPNQKCEPYNGEYLCQLDLINPSRFCEETGHESTYMCKLNDRTGAVEYHEHNDRRIHVEGTFRQKQDATLRRFFRTFGGELTNTKLTYPTNDKVYKVKEGDGKTLKIILNRGVGGERGWCVIGQPGDGVAEEDICRDTYDNKPAYSPSQYVISPYQRGPPLDDIWIVYDDAPTSEVLQDLREDGEYRNFKQEKTAGAEGY
jgi:hypothetical protein